MTAYTAADSIEIMARMHGIERNSEAEERMDDAEAQEEVQRGVTVSAPIERAFAVFTEEMGRWWPAANTFAKDRFETVQIEPRTGDRWFERASNGSETAWGRVLDWQPPHSLVLTWQITQDGQPEPDPRKASEVDVRFAAETPERTRVAVTHRAFERHGEAAAETWRAAMASPPGWDQFLRLYARQANA